LAKPDSLADVTVDLVSAAANPVMGLIKHPRPDGAATGRPVMPVRDPSATVAEIAAAASARLPGTALHRRLFFRTPSAGTSPDDHARRQVHRGRRNRVS
jgi:hypothetical protein